MRIRWPLALVLAGLLTGTQTVSVQAQLYSTDPYDPDGRAFRAYAYPGAGEVYGGMGGTPRSRGAFNSPNQFDRADDDLGFSTSGLGARGGSRYDSAYRQLDRSYGREYIPNEQADKSYYANREKRERDMMRAMAEKDPRKRDKMIREAEQEAMKGASEVGLSVRRGVSAGTTKVPQTPSRLTVRATGNTSSTTVGNAPGRRSRSDAPTVPPAPSRNSNGTRSGTRDSTIPPPPSTGRSESPSRTESRPSDVLERSRNMDRPTSTRSPRRVIDNP